MMKAYFCFLIFAIFTVDATAQSPYAAQIVFFEKGSRDIASPDGLSGFGAGLKQKSRYRILIQGHTDNIGSASFNRTLSLKRADAVKRMLISFGVIANRIEVRGFGFEHPVAENNTESGRTSNRRAEIFLSLPEPDSVAALFRLLQTVPQRFCINNKRDSILRCRQGSQVRISANTFVPENCQNQCISILIKEDLKKSDMILDRLSTTSNGSLLETGGMIFTQIFDCNGRELEPQKPLLIMIPTDSVNPEATLFRGDRNTEGLINWISDDYNSKFMSCDPWEVPQCIEEPDTSAKVFADKLDTDPACKKCAFLFCRAGRIGKAVSGSFDKKQRARNKAFRICQSSLKKKKPANTTPALPLAITPPQPALSPEEMQKNLENCKKLRELFALFNVSNIDDLKLAMFKPLMDSLGITGLKALNDTLAAIKKRRIEMNYQKKDISYDDFNYYVFNTTRTGWSNVDCFSRLPQSKLVTVMVENDNDNWGVSCDYKLVFTERKAIMPPNGSNKNTINFIDVPKNEKATLIAIKYEDGKAFLAVKEITIAAQTYHLEFKQLSIDELRQRIKFLDR